MAAQMEAQQKKQAPSSLTHTILSLHMYEIQGSIHIAHSKTLT